MVGSDELFSIQCRVRGHHSVKSWTGRTLNTKERQSLRQEKQWSTTLYVKTTSPALPQNYRTHRSSLWRSHTACYIDYSSYLGVPRVARGRARRREGREEVRFAERREPDLSHRVLVRPSCAAENAVLEHDQSCPEGLSVNEIIESDRGQVSAVADEQRLFAKHGLYFGDPVLWGQRGGVGSTFKDNGNGRMLNFAGVIIGLSGFCHILRSI